MSIFQESSCWNENAFASVFEWNHSWGRGGGGRNYPQLGFIAAWSWVPEDPPDLGATRKFLPTAPSKKSTSTNWISWVCRFQSESNFSPQYCTVERWPGCLLHQIWNHSRRWPNTYIRTFFFECEFIVPYTIYIPILHFSSFSCIYTILDTSFSMKMTY